MRWGARSRVPGSDRAPTLALRCRCAAKVTVLAVGPGPRLRGGPRKGTGRTFFVLFAAQHCRVFLHASPRQKAHSQPLHLLLAAAASLLRSSLLSLHSAYCGAARPAVSQAGRKPLRCPAFFLIRPIAVDAAVSIKVPFTPQKVKKGTPRP